MRELDLLAASGYNRVLSLVGRVSAVLLRKRAELGRRINERMWRLGITPVFPAFIGHVTDKRFGTYSIPSRNIGGELEIGLATKTT